MVTITPHENDQDEETRVAVKNRENEADQLHRRFREQRSQGAVILTISATRE